MRMKSDGTIRMKSDGIKSDGTITMKIDGIKSDGTIRMKSNGTKRTESDESIRVEGDKYPCKLARAYNLTMVEFLNSLETWIIHKPNDLIKLTSTYCHILSIWNIKDFWAIYVTGVEVFGSRLAVCITVALSL